MPRFRDAMTDEKEKVAVGVGRCLALIVVWVVASLAAYFVEI